MPVFNIHTPRYSGFEPPIMVTGDCRSGHSISYAATMPEFRAGNMMVYCAGCEAYVLPIWDFSPWERTDTTGTIIEVSTETQS